MGDVISKCTGDVGSLTDEVDGIMNEVVVASDDPMQWVEFELGVSVAEEVAEAIAPIRAIYNVIKAIGSYYRKYEEYEDMQKWLQRLAEDVADAATQANKLSIGTSERMLLDDALEDARLLLDKIGFGAARNAKDIQLDIQQIKEHLHQRRSSAISSAHYGSFLDFVEEWQQPPWLRQDFVPTTSLAAVLTGGVNCNDCSTAKCEECPSRMIGRQMNGNEILKLRKAQKHTEIVDLCSEWIKIEPQEPYPHIQLAIALGDLNRISEAHDQFKILVELFKGYDKVPPPMQFEMTKYGFPSNQSEEKSIHPQMIQQPVPPAANSHKACCCSIQ